MVQLVPNPISEAHSRSCPTNYVCWFGVPHLMIIPKYIKGNFNTTTTKTKQTSFIKGSTLGFPLCLRVVRVVGSWHHDFTSATVAGTMTLHQPPSHDNRKETAAGTGGVKGWRWVSLSGKHSRITLTWSRAQLLVFLCAFGLFVWLVAGTMTLHQPPKTPL